MHEAHKCPKCSSYIIGDFCYICNINIRDYKLNNEEIPDILKDIWKEKR